eukprot:GHVR01093075.1.p1 GENE.GHVR01093075.1~~GHVR01093075.1.p1  ORF type:complete len:284 (+),score=85.13 GHVR01093075.1:215-1066(+)
MNDIKGNLLFFQEIDMGREVRVHEEEPEIQPEEKKDGVTFVTTKRTIISSRNKSSFQIVIPPKPMEGEIHVEFENFEGKGDVSVLQTNKIDIKSHCRDSEELTKLYKQYGELKEIKNNKEDYEYASYGYRPDRHTLPEIWGDKISKAIYKVMSYEYEKDGQTIYQEKGTVTLISTYPSSHTIKLSDTPIDHGSAKVCLGSKCVKTLDIPRTTTYGFINKENIDNKDAKKDDDKDKSDGFSTITIVCFIIGVIIGIILLYFLKVKMCSGDTTSPLPPPTTSRFN